MRCRRRSNRRTRREGAVLPWLLVCLGVILSIVALALDGGRMMQERRHCQNAADAAALAAASDMYLNYAKSSQTGASHATSIDAALEAAADFSYANDQKKSIVTVNIPPTSGSYAGKANYVEVLVQSNLAGSFGTSITGQKLVVKARSVAKGRPMAIGLFALSPTAAGAISLSNNATVTVNNAGVRVNSSASNAISITGNAHASAPWFSVVGNLSTGLSLNHPATTGADVLPDPLVALPVPDQTNMTIQRTTTLSYTSNAVHTLSPGIYRGGIKLAGNSTTILQPGVYVLQGGLSVSGNANVSGTGVFLYNTYTQQTSMSALAVGGNGSINLSAATSGPYQGIVFMQDRGSDVGVSLSGNASTQIGGVLYAPAATISLSGNGSSSNPLGGGILANKIAISGNGNVTIDGGSNLPPIPQINLVE